MNVSAVWHGYLNSVSPKQTIDHDFTTWRTIMKKGMNFQILGYPVVTILIASFWLLVATWMWWGSLFNGENIATLPAWPALNGLTETAFDNMPISWQLVGAGAILLQTLGLATLLRWRNATTVTMAIQTGLIAGLFFAVPIAIYPLSFRPEHNVMLFLVDAGNYLVGLMTTAVLLTFLPGIREKREAAGTIGRSAVAA